MVTCCATMLPSLDSPTIASCTLATGTRTVSERSLLTRRDRGVDDVPLEPAGQVEYVLRRPRDGIGIRDLDGQRRAHALGPAGVGAIAVSASPPETVPDSVAPSPTHWGPESSNRRRWSLRGFSAGSPRWRRRSGTVRRLPHLQTRARLRQGSRSAPPGARESGIVQRSLRRVFCRELPYTCPQLGGCSRARAELVDQFRRRRHGLSAPLFELRGHPTQPRRDGGRRDRAGGPTPHCPGRGRSAARLRARPRQGAETLLEHRREALTETLRPPEG